MKDHNETENAYNLNEENIYKRILLRFPPVCFFCLDSSVVSFKVLASRPLGEQKSLCMLSFWSSIRCQLLPFYSRLLLLLEGVCGAEFQRCCPSWILRPLFSSGSCALLSSSRHGPAMFLHGTHTHTFSTTYQLTLQKKENTVSLCSNEKERKHGSLIQLLYLKLLVMSSPPPSFPNVFLQACDM